MGSGTGFGFTDAIDLLAQLPMQGAGRKRNKYVKGQIVFVPDSAEERRIHLVQSGSFMTFATRHGTEVGIEYLEIGELFGLETLVGRSQTLAKCAQDGETLSWDAAELDKLQRENAQLAVGLSQAAINRGLRLQRHIEDFAVLMIAERLAAFLAERAELKVSDEDGTVLLSAITHETMSEFIGTSREIVTHYLNAFRKAGYVDYNRKGIRVYDPKGLVQWARDHREPLIAKAATQEE